MADARQQSLQKRQARSKQPQRQQQHQQPLQQAVIPRPAIHPTLVPELLGFSPQMLLDDIISSASDAIVLCLQAMEPFMQRWATNRVPPPPQPDTGKSKGKKGKKKSAETAKEEAEWDGLEAVEQGLVAFSTLLESHTDIAFDFFEAWSLRNIFAVPPDLALVAPHQRGLDLDVRVEEEVELMTEIEELRRRIENQRRLKRMYTKALRLSRLRLLSSTHKLSRLSHLSPTSPLVHALSSLPPSITALFESAASLPHMDGAGGALQMPVADPSKRPWETGDIGYTNWAVQQMVMGWRGQSSNRSRSGSGKESEEGPRSAGGSGSGSGSATLQSVEERTERVGRVEEVKAFLSTLGESREVEAGEEEEEEDEDEDEEAMDTT